MKISHLMLGNYLTPSLSIFWVRKTLTLQYMCILVGLSQFCGWFRVCFVLVERFRVKMAKTGPFSGSARHPYT